MTARFLTTNGTRLRVLVQGSGPPVVLLHGFPHVAELWDLVVPRLAERFTVIAPDLRGLGGSSRDVDSFTAGAVAADTIGLLNELGLPTAAVVGIDLGAPAAFLTAQLHPDRVRRLVVMEALIGELPGAESFLAAGPPWWFGFHAVPGLAETVVAGQEEAYLDFFLTTGTGGAAVDEAFRTAVLAAYRGRDALAAAFEHYRAFPASAEEIRAATNTDRLIVPTLAIGGSSAAAVGDVTARQLAPLADDLRSVVLDSGHIIPQHRPAALAGQLLDFLGSDHR